MSGQVLRNLEADYEEKRISGYWPVLLFTFNIGEDCRYDAGGRALFERHEHGFSMVCETVAWSKLTFSESDLSGLRSVAEKYYMQRSCEYVKQLIAIRSISGLMERSGKEVIYNQASAHSVGRNEQCPCGSGKKFKRCCGLVQ
jgi:hypothetical protein